MAIETPPELVPSGPVDATPARRAGSVRRTTSIDMTWDDGIGTPLTLSGRGRDLATQADGQPAVLADERLVLRVSPERRIEQLLLAEHAEGEQCEISELIGIGAMGGFRASVAERVPQMMEARRPSSLLMDDVPGATLISGFAASRWHPLPLLVESARASGHVRRMEGICTGFQPGSSGLAPDGTSRWNHRTRAVRRLADDPDPWAWHEIGEPDGMAMRRLRRIDVWQEGGEIHVDAMFQDSSTTPDGGRDAVHEYSLTAVADARTAELLAVDATPRVLPYAECPLAVQNIGQVIGVRLEDLRAVVLERLAGVAGCTHLNDALRALADVPHLTQQLRKASHD